MPNTGIMAPAKEHPMKPSNNHGHSVQFILSRSVMPTFSMSGLNKSKNFNSSFKINTISYLNTSLRVYLNVGNSILTSFKMIQGCNVTLIFTKT